MSVRRREYKLHYFDMKGRGEVCRLILARKYNNKFWNFLFWLQTNVYVTDTKVPYEDIRYSFAEWPQQKSSNKTLFEKIPIKFLSFPL